MWPCPLTILDMRLLLHHGKQRPAPGPDGWEKWWIKALSDSALQLVVNLLNYEITTSTIPACLKLTTISTIHKKGSHTQLANYCGVACSNFLLNFPFAWLNFLLLPYIARHSILPPTQLATQQGVQARDILSFIAMIVTWANQEHQPLFVLKCDQKKGFDMLEPEGFYDTLTAYGFPLSIITLNKSAQSDVPYAVKMAYGLMTAF